MPPRDLEPQLRAVIDRTTSGAWRVTRLWLDNGGVCLSIDGAWSAGALTLEVRIAIAGQPAYRVANGFAFSYRGDALPRSQHALLDRVVAALATVVTKDAFEATADEVVELSGRSTFPTPYQRAHLESEAALSPDAIETYRRDGHVLVRHAVNPDVILAAAPHVHDALGARRPRDLPPVDQRQDAYSRSFTQITDVGREDPVVRALSQARRIVQMAAALMGVSRVRSFCEDWLIKEPGADITPWHQDEAVFPFDAEATITCWIPLQDIRLGDGLLRFARGSQRYGVAPVENISDISEAEFARIIADNGFPIDELPPVFVGDISFHHGRMIHGAFPNTGDQVRVVLAIHCFADGARLKKPTTPTMAQLFDNSVPGRAPGELALSDRWPLLFDATAPAVAGRDASDPGKRFHLRATLLPEESLADLWIEDGILRGVHGVDDARHLALSFEGATEVAPPGGFVMCGLVDCHSHISYPHDRKDPAGTVGWMNARRSEYAHTGVLLLRDMGAVDDGISRLLDVPGLPRVHASGNMILRHQEWPFTPTEPHDLVHACAERIHRGARWTKVFADWSSDYRGRINSGFTGSDDVTYPLPLLTEAVAAVHAAGGRLAAHAFTRAGAVVAIRAGVDALEHGWGVDEDLVGEMAQRGVAWVPLVGIAQSMWRIARREGESDRAEWIAETMARLRTLVPMATLRGVRIFAGTDRFPEVTVGDEIQELHDLGMSREGALGAAAWAARAWLGEPGLVVGAPADLVLFRSDPRIDVRAVESPELIMSGGELVAPSVAHVRPRRLSWIEASTESSGTPRK